jgi:TonB-dependent SusC/RagA subfamily outer membrane receptor
MKMSLGSYPVLRHPWFLGALALLFLPTCALTPEAEEGTAPQPQPETVDVGYVEVEKETLSGGIGNVDSREVQGDRSKTLAEMLARVPGVRVTQTGGGNFSVRIRESNSFLGGQEPLWVVDGMIVNGGPAAINPNTIESITVLKNAGDTAIYGSRGANGVILIKTRK